MLTRKQFLWQRYINAAVHIVVGFPAVHIVTCLHVAAVNEDTLFNGFHDSYNPSKYMRSFCDLNQKCNTDCVMPGLECARMLHCSPCLVYIGSVARSQFHGYISQNC